MLKFIAISGTTSVTHNLYVYETQKDMIVVDCGVGFPEVDMRGVDLVLPDFSYVIKNKQKLRAIFLSQGHEDHQGALPFLFKDINPPIYATELVSEFVKDKFEENEIKNAQIRLLNPDEGEIKVGDFTVRAFRVSHSIPDTVGFAIDTPEGRIFHVAEHKFDPNPEDHQLFDLKRAENLAKDGVLFLASDCLGSNRPGSTPTEGKIEENLYKVFSKAKSAIYFTAISSNIGRFQQAINAAQRLGRKVSIVGFSISRKVEIAHGLGYINYQKETIISHKQAANLNPNKVVYLIAGCYGQEGSSLYRLSLNQHPKISLEKGSLVVFSADPAPPYTKESQDFVIDNLFDIGADVIYYDNDQGLYVSGHGSQDDITRLFDIVKPKYLAPIGGTIRFMYAYEKLAKNWGAESKHIFKLKPGDSIIFENQKARLGPRVSISKVLVDGLGVGDVGRRVLEDRKRLAQSGFLLAVVEIDKKQKKLISNPRIISRGFVFEKESREFITQTEQNLGRFLRGKMTKNKNALEKAIVDYLEKYLFENIGRKPIILPIVLFT